MAKAKKKIVKSAAPKKKSGKVSAKPAKKSVKKAVKAPAKAVAKKPASIKSVAKKPAAKATSVAKPATKTQIAKLAVSLAPLDDRILVQVEKGERITAGGLIVPDSASVTGNNRGLVVAVGKGHTNLKGKFRPTELRVGDRILFSEYAGSEVDLGSDKFKIMRETDVLGLVDSE